MTNTPDRTLVPVEQVELLPCPFCGGEAWTNEACANYWTICGDCCANGQSCDSLEQAIAAWNARAASSTPIPVSGEVERALSGDWFKRNADRRNPQAFINTNPAYFADECAAAIAALNHTPAPPTSLADLQRLGQEFDAAEASDSPVK